MSASTHARPRESHDDHGIPVALPRIVGLIVNPTTTLIEHVLHFRNERQDVLAANIANADTPGYRAFDVVLDEQLGGGPGLAVQRNSPRHLSENPEGSPPSSAVASRAPARLDGNNVSLDHEFLQLTENRLMYQAAFELYENFGGLMRLAREVR